MDKTNGIKNIIAGLLANILTFAFGLIIPRLVLVKLGSEANGLLNSVSSVLGYLSLLEAGVGTASLHALFKPCGEDDKESINSIMAATNFFYRRTGTIYLLIIVGLSIFYTIIVKTEFPKIEVFVVVLLCGLSGVISYFFQGKFKIFLSAEGKSYITTNLNTFIHIFTSITKAVLLYKGFGVVEVQLSSFLLNIVQVVYFEIYMKRHYHWLDFKVKPNFDAINQKNAVLVHQVTSLIFSNTDVLILTLLAGLREVSVYSMYAMIYGMVKWLAVVIYESYTYMLGQTYDIDRNRFMKMFNAYEIGTMMVTFSLYCICRALINPFLKLYTAGVTDIQYVDPYLPWMFAIFYLLHNGRTSSATVINIAQRFDDTKWRAVLESVINLTVSLLCVYQFGIYGVLMGTIVALLYRSNDMIIYASKILKRSCLVTYKRWIINIGAFIISSIVINQFSLFRDSYVELVIVAIPVSIFIVALFIGINVIFERDSIIYIIKISTSILKRDRKK